MIGNVENTLWVESFRPDTLEGYIGNEHIIEKVKIFIANGDVPHLLFYGSAGTGKTTLAKIIANSVDADLMYINASDENSVDAVRDNLNYEESTIVEGLEDYEELWSISFCQNNIMSNSSFSWWGSYLNKNNNKKVFVPSIWFGPNGEKNYQDIYEKEWIKINVNFKNGKLIY